MLPGLRPKVLQSKRRRINAGRLRSRIQQPGARAGAPLYFRALDARCGGLSARGNEGAACRAWVELRIDTASGDRLVLAAPRCDSSPRAVHSRWLLALA